MLRLLLSLAVFTLAATSSLAAEPVTPPPVAREFRAAWIATVANIDWPSRPGLTNDELKAELAGLLDVCVRLKLNAVVLQVRPACDTIYASELEPWSEFLTGKQGQAPPDGFDPLAWACEQAHARGLELHAWFNPYRATHPSAKGPLDPSHIAVKRPDLAPQYGDYRWLDPGAADASAHSLAVIVDVVRRYEVDAVHFDDYFYPYPVSDALEGSEKQVEVPFPDDASWEAYCDATAEEDRLLRNDWRRDNVNRFIQDVAQAVHAAKPHVRLGVSPFGIWRPGTPPGIAGFDPYEKLYADARRWLSEGWVDYLSPQLYWAIDQKPQSFTKLLGWWGQQNPLQRNLWPGLYTSRLGGEKPAYAPEEIVNQIVAARSSGGSGHIHFSMKALSGNWGKIADTLATGAYADAALPPDSAWLAGEAPSPAAPSVTRVADSNPPQLQLATAASAPSRWVLQKRCGDKWTTGVLGGQVEMVRLKPAADGAPANAAAVYTVDEFGRLSPPKVLSFD